MCAEFFGKIDRKEGGKIRSQYPSWYFDKAVDDLRETINDKEKLIQNPAMDQEVKFNTIESIERDKKRLKEIEGSKPKLRAGDKDKLAKMRKQLGEEITSLMPSESDDRRGRVDIFKETQKMTQGCVKVDGEMADIVQSMGCQVDENGMISRNQATKAWQIAGKLLDENTDSGSLQRDHNYGLTKFEKSLRELFREVGLEK